MIQFIRTFMAAMLLLGVSFEAAAEVLAGNSGAGADYAVDSIEALIEASEETTGKSRHKVGLTAEFREKGAKYCSRFIQDNGEYGVYGQILYKTLMKDARIRRVLIDDADKRIAKDPVMQQVCPGFTKLSKEDRARFWIWTMAAIAWDESKCDGLVKPKKGPNDTLIGLFQLEDRRSSRAWRGEYCGVKDIKPVDAQLRCAIDIMRGQYECTPGKAACNPQKGTYGTPSLKSSYWEKLRRTGTSTIKARISKFPGCKG